MSSAEVRYFLGRTGAGKSYRMMEEMVADLKNGGDYPLLLLVPEQFTLQAERDLIEQMNLPGIMRVEVLSFTRLAYRVFNEVGGLTRTTISEQGKNMILRKIINDNLESLTIYKKAARQTGLVEKVSSLLASCKQQGIIPADLEQMAENLPEGNLGLKMQDLALLYQKFDDYLQGRYLDTEDRVNLFINKLEESQFIREARIWIDGFTTYSRQSLNIIQKLMCQARQTTISFTINNNDDPDSDLFYLSAQSYRLVRDIARGCGLRQEVVQFMPRPGLNGKNPELEFLEKELYAYPYRIYSGPVNKLRLFASTSVQNEVENAARQVVALAREEGYRWKEIAVVCNNIESYGDLISRTFARYGIPCFMDLKRGIMTNPLVQLVLSTLHVLDRDFQPDDVFRLLKTGLTNIPPDICEKLENYALQYGIRGAKWRNPFTLGDEQLTAELNPWREALVAPLENLRHKLKGRLVCGQINRALYDFLHHLGVEDRLAGLIDELNAREKYNLASENAQIWNIIMTILDQVDEFMGDQETLLKDYSKVLEAGFMTYEVGIIPTTIDQVLVGNIQRSKSHDIRALLVLGANEGVLPSTGEEEDLLSPLDKETLQTKGLDLCYERETKAREERFLIYSALGKPTDYLFLSWSLADREGKAMRPSILVDRLKKLFPHIDIKSDLDIRNSELDEVTTPLATFNHLIESLRCHLDGKPVENFWWDVYGWYYIRPEWLKLRHTALKGFAHSNQLEYIESKQALGLYGQTLYSSVSRLEKFAACPFAHFVRYGLTPRERKMFTVEWPDLGDILHQGLYDFAAALESRGLEWGTLEKNDCDEIMGQVMEDIIAEHNEGVLTSTYRYRYLGQRLKRIGCRSAWTLTEHLQKGDFEPAEFEVRFGRGGKFPPVLVELENGQQLLLEGRIDRVDLLETEEATYAKIIDYKTGNKKLDLPGIYYGLSLQLLIYLQAVLAVRRNPEHPMKPGGIFYFKLDDPIVNLDKITSSVEQALAKELRMKGLVLKDVSVAMHMDRDIGNSDVIPAALNRDGEFTRYSSVVTEEEFMALLGHVRNLIREMGGEILKGRVALEPVSQAGKTACEYCTYWPICQFDRLLPDNNYRILKNLGQEEIIARVVEEVKNHANLD